MGERKKCYLCEHKHICIKLADYVKNINRRNKFSRKLCKGIKTKTNVMERLINLAILG